MGMEVRNKPVLQDGAVTVLDKYAGQPPIAWTII
jgi:hypothetical protein